MEKYQEINDLLGEAWNKFLDLQPKTDLFNDQSRVPKDVQFKYRENTQSVNSCVLDNDEVRNFRDGIHNLQRIITTKFVKDTKPEFFGLPQKLELKTPIASATPGLTVEQYDKLLKADKYNYWLGIVSNNAHFILGPNNLKYWGKMTPEEREDWVNKICLNNY